MCWARLWTMKNCLNSPLTTLHKMIRKLFGTCGNGKDQLYPKGHLNYSAVRHTNIHQKTGDCSVHLILKAFALASCLPYVCNECTLSANRFSEERV